MIAFLRYRSELAKLRKVQRRLAGKAERAYARMSTEGHDDGEWSYVAQQEEETAKWISFHQTEYFRHICERLIMPMPDVSDPTLYETYNFDDNHGDRHILTTAGFHRVRNDVREERKRRREAFGFWTTIGIGLIGALIGLISAWKSGS